MLAYIRLITGFLFALAAVSVTAKPIDSKGFRDIFLSSLGDSVSASDLAYLDYTPTQALDQAPAESSVEGFLQRLASTYSQAVPSTLFRDGQQAGASRIAEGVWKDALRKNPLTVVVLPGVFSEFIDVRVFEEVFSQPSTFANSWRERIGHNADSADAWDSYDYLPSPTPNRTTLNNLIDVTSINDRDGRPLVRAVLMRAPRLSLESIGDLRHISEITVRRLEKFFRLMGTPKNIVFLGYSRGSMVGLEILARAREMRSPWLNNVRGLIALGGVNFGSDLADEVLIRGTASYRQLNLLRQLRQRLQPLDPKASVFTRARVAYANARAWSDFSIGIAAVGIERSLLAAMLSTLLPGQMTDLHPTMKLLAQLAATFGQDVRHLQKFIDALDVTLLQLTTSARLQWWRQNLIPTHGIHYYAIAGTLVEPREDRMLADNPIAHNRKLFDYKFSLNAYRHMRSTFGFALNDSQMAVHKVRFWPELIHLLNPKQEPVEASFLGVVGTHHWGLTLPVVTSMRNQAHDPFPRSALFQALATTVAMDLDAP